MKKKILFIMPSMFIGGAERSLLGLLEFLDYSNVDAYLFLYRHKGEFIKYIPEQVNLLEEVPAYGTFDVPIKSLLLRGDIPFAVARLNSKIAKSVHSIYSKEKAGVWMSMQYTSEYLQKLLPQVEGEYDAAVMFLGVPDTLINKVNAKVKLAWCHTDYDTLKPDRKKDLKVYSEVDRLVAVSDDCAAKIRKYYPCLSNKIMVIENVLSGKLIWQQAAEPVTDLYRSRDEKILLSVGRFSHAKNFDNVPWICKRILESGINVKWYLIGYGGDGALIRRNIADAGMEEHVIILGKKENPYPYIAACDLYVQPSRYEGKCVTVREAQMLGKPVVITRYATSSSQLEENVDGVIVPMDNEGCAEGIVQLLRDPEKMMQLMKKCRERDYTSSEEINKLMALL